MIDRSVTTGQSAAASRAVLSVERFSAVNGAARRCALGRRGLQPLADLTDNHTVSGQIPPDQATVVTCGSCGTKLKVRALAVVGQNRKGKCPKCGTMLVIALPASPPPLPSGKGWGEGEHRAAFSGNSVVSHTKTVVTEVTTPPREQADEREAARKVLADWKPPVQAKALTLGGTLASAVAAACGSGVWWVTERFTMPLHLWIVKRSGIAFAMGMAIAIAMLLASGRRGPAARIMCAMLAVLAIVSAKVAAGAGPGVFDPLFLSVALAGSTLCFIISQPSSPVPSPSGRGLG